MRILYDWVVIIIFVLLANGLAVAEQQNSIIKDIEEVISQGESAPSTKFEEIKNKIETDSEGILPLLLNKVNTSNLPEANLTIYVWAIGLTKSSKAIDDIIKLSSGNHSELFLTNAYKALTTIGGERSGEYLYKKLRETSV